VGEVKKSKLLQKIYSNRKNVRFDDFKSLVESFSFICLRISGNHHIFKKQGVFEMLNLQNFKGQAKPYQINQFFSLVEKYNLSQEEDT
jgi:hypothetical protein